MGTSLFVVFMYWTFSSMLYTFLAFMFSSSLTVLQAFSVSVCLEGERASSTKSSHSLRTMRVTDGLLARTSSCRATRYSDRASAC